MHVGAGGAVVVAALGAADAEAEPLADGAAACWPCVPPAVQPVSSRAPLAARAASLRPCSRWANNLIPCVYRIRPASARASRPTSCAVGVEALRDRHASIRSAGEEFRGVGDLDGEVGETGRQDSGEAQVDVPEIVARLVVAPVSGPTGLSPGGSGLLCRDRVQES